MIFTVASLVIKLNKISVHIVAKMSIVYIVLILTIVKISFCEIFTDSSSDEIQETSCPFYFLQFGDTSNLFQFVVHGIFLPILALFGLLSNIISIFIFTRPEMRTTINLILTGKKRSETRNLSDFVLKEQFLQHSGVAVTDLLTITSILVIAIADAWKIPLPDIKYLFMFPFGCTAYFGSMYLTVLLTLVRYLAVCRKKHFTVKETKISMASIFLLVIIYNLPKWMMFRWETNQYGVSEIKITKFACDPTFYKVYFAGGNGLFIFILPTLMLIIPNVLMHKEVLTSDALKTVPNSLLSSME